MPSSRLLLSLKPSSQRTLALRNLKRDTASISTVAVSGTANMPPVFSSEDSDLISSLIELSEKSPKLVRSSLFAVQADPSIEIRSWKMNEFKYYDVPSPFPTLARGLFSKVIRDDDPENDDKRKGKKKSKTHRIIVRGYDKFFNIGEVPWTSVSTYLRFKCLINGVYSVGMVGGTYCRSLYAFSQVERVHYLHRRAYSNETPDHIETFPWACPGCVA